MLLSNLFAVGMLQTTPRVADKSPRQRQETPDKIRERPTQASFTPILLSQKKTKQAIKADF